MKKTPKKKLTRAQRVLVRMETMEAKLQDSTRRADTLIIKHQKKVAKAAKVKKAKPAITSDQREILCAMATIESKCGSLLGPISSLIRVAVKQGGDAKALADYDQAVKMAAPTPAKPAVKLPFKPMSLVKLTSNPNHHDYPLNKPVLVMVGETGCVWDTKAKAWKFGNNMPTDLSCYESVTMKEMAKAAENFDVLPNIPTVK